MSVETGDVVRVTIRYEGPNLEDYQNSYLFAVGLDESISDSEFLALIEPAMTNLYGGLTGAISSECDPRDISCYVVDYDTVNNKEVITHSIGTTPWTTIAFTAASEMLPAGVAALANFTTNALKTRLSKYIGGIVEVEQDDGTFGSSMVGYMTDWIAELLAGITLEVGKTMVYGGFSKATEQFAAATGGAFTAIPAYQRRRRPGTGS